MLTIEDIIELEDAVEANGGMWVIPPATDPEERKKHDEETRRLMHAYFDKIGHTYNKTTDNH